MIDFIVTYHETVYHGDGDYHDEEYDQVLLFSRDEAAARQEAEDLLPAVLACTSRFDEADDPAATGRENTSITVEALTVFHRRLMDRAVTLAKSKANHRPDEEGEPKEPGTDDNTQ